MLREDEKHLIRTCFVTLREDWPGFRPRRPQLQMVAAVAKALGNCVGPEEAGRQGGNISVVEAGTGTGKTVGYLVPALVLARSRGKHLVVSSSTVALQEQLAQKDAPALQHVLPIPFTFAVAKGRGRYACVAKLLQKAEEGAQGSLDLLPVAGSGARSAPTTPNAVYLQLAQQFEQQVWSGDRDELAAPVADEVWQELVTDRQGCAGSRCPHFARCPFYAARQRVREADLIIANHDLVLSTLDLPAATVLPEPKDAFFIFDEAHRLPAKVLEHFAVRHALRGAAIWASDIGAVAQDCALALHLSAPNPGEFQQAATALCRHLEAIYQQVDRSGAGAARPVWRFAYGVVPAWLRASGCDLLTAARELQAGLQDLREAILARADKEAQLVQRLLAHLGFYLGRLEHLIATWELLLADDAGRAPAARWIEQHESSQGTHDYLVCASPIEGGERLYQLLWQRVSGAVLTSATLTVGGSFRPFLQQTGLSRLPCTQLLQVDSPFDYGNCARLVVPAMRSDPRDATAHTREVGARLPALIDTAGTLVLFTSARQLNAVYDRLPATLQQVVLKQGTASKAELLARHRAAIDSGRRSVIFGLASFAEGVDLPGHYCTHVIIAKLPFAVPDTPLEAARREWVEGQGKSAFTEITLSETAVRLAQGVGRLLRTEQDHGMVTILDRRLATRPWGKVLLRSLPPFRLEIAGRLRPVA